MVKGEHSGEIIKPKFPFSTWIDEVHSKTKYANLIYKYFRLLYDNPISPTEFSTIASSLDSLLKENYNPKHFFRFVKSYQNQQEDKGILKKIKSLLSIQK